MDQLGKYRVKIIDALALDGIEQIKSIRKNHPGKKIVFASGCYDLVHSGHVIFFEQLKQHGDIVVIGLGRDSTVKEIKREPVRNEMDRAYLLAAFECIDYVILDNDYVVDGKIEFLGVIKTLLPDVFVLNSDDSAIEIKRTLCNELGIAFEMVDRIVPGFLSMTSTTQIINKIKNGKY